MGWDLEKAITKSTAKKRVYEEHLTEENLKKLEKIGVSPYVFKERLRKGMELERALTQPFGKGHRKYKYPQEYVKIAQSNGISHSTFILRIKKGWSFEEASTRKPMTRKEAAQCSRKKGGVFNDKK
jgi:hypothetical protein